MAVEEGIKFLRGELQKLESAIEDRFESLEKRFDSQNKKLDLLLGDRRIIIALGTIWVFIGPFIADVLKLYFFKH